MKNKSIQEIFREFNEEEIEFLVLRNYSDMEKEKDVDLAINKEDKKKVEKIAKKFKLKKGISLGYYLSLRNNFVWLDIRAGGIVYNGFLFSNFKSIYQRKRKYGNFFILSEEDELVHLILHSIIDKEFYKEVYIGKIEELMSSVNEDELKKILIWRLGGLGNKIFYLVKGKKYAETLKLRRKLLLKLFRIRDLHNFIILNLVKILR